MRFTSFPSFIGSLGLELLNLETFRHSHKNKLESDIGSFWIYEMRFGIELWHSIVPTTLCVSTGRNRKESAFTHKNNWNRILVNFEFMTAHNIMRFKRQESKGIEAVHCTHIWITRIFMFFQILSFCDACHHYLDFRQLWLQIIADSYQVSNSIWYLIGATKGSIQVLFRANKDTMLVANV